MEMRPKTIFLEVINKPIVYAFFKDFTNHRKKTSKAVHFRHRPLSNILNYSHHRSDLQTVWKTRFLQALIEEFC